MKKWSPGVLVVLAFLACDFLTSPDYIGDTTRYVKDALDHAAGKPAPFWEFGHLVWRPWALFGQATLEYGREGDTPAQAATRFLIHTNLVCSIGVLLLLYRVVRRVAGVSATAAAVFGMSCANAFLTYSQSGAPYVPALLFSTASVLLLVKGSEQPSVGIRYGIAAGVSFAVACALWFPFSLVGLGLLLIPYSWPSANPGFSHERRPVAASFLLALGAATVLLFASGAVAERIGTIDEFRIWVRESDNGWSQSLNAVRAITGFPRVVWNFSEDTVLLKRWVFSDPYNPVPSAAPIAGLGAKLALFYLGLIATFWVLWKENRRILLLCGAVGIPLLFFAVVVFEPSSPERFLPGLPFAALAVAVVIDRIAAHRAAATCVLLLLGASTVINLATSGTTTLESRVVTTARRIEALDTAVKPGSLVYLVTMNDDLYRLPNVHPLDDRLTAKAFWCLDAIEIASTRLLHWRSEFNAWTQQQWAAGKDVWLSERLLAERPEADWLWVEGDSPVITWRELPATFTQFEFDATVMPGNDGFVRLARTPGNEERLRTLAP
jgi:hypothetical protein